MCIRDSVEVIVGTPLQEVLDFCGVKEGVTVGKVIMGGPMMGVAVADLATPVLKQNNGLLAVSYTHLDVYKRQGPLPPHAGGGPFGRRGGAGGLSLPHRDVYKRQS